jgi:hypothetical protein
LLPAFVKIGGVLKRATLNSASRDIRFGAGGG